MPTSVVRDLAQAAQVQQALSVLAPPNTISVLRTLDRNGGGLPVAGFADAMPWMGANLGPRLAAMQRNNLVSRARSAGKSVVSLTVAGRDALRIQISFTRWASAHQRVPEAGTGMGAYTEQALGSLNLSHTVATVWALASEGEAVYPSEIQDLVLPADGPHRSSLYRRLAQMQSAGLVVRSGEDRFYMYELTQAGRDLADPLEVLARWAERHVPTSAEGRAPQVTRTQAATITRSVTTAAAVPPVASQPSPAARAAARAQAASLRSVTSSLAFSHQAPPQPAPLVANSAPARQR
ncbi:winged helix-turn-helix transcriptional regulator [Kitasatospora purpeofusca]|uniref:winged helix-turn-helix transcriptional regulator n=1 Tax=Kitasatospora purpeofusca TaxID=67352 RepID=UPI0035DE5DD4